VLSSAVDVFAAVVKDDVINQSATCSLTIHKYDTTAAKAAGVDVTKFTADGEQDADAESALSKYALKGVEFTYLKVGSINTDTNAGALKLLYDIPESLETKLGLSGGAGRKYTSDQLNSALETLLSNNTTGKNTLEDYVTQNGGVTMSDTNESGVTSVSSLAAGLYLVVETKVPEEVHTTTNPFFVSLPMTDATGDYWNYDVVVYPKNQTENPTIDKLVSENGKDFTDVVTASEGDTLDYKIIAKIPEITSKSTYLNKFTFKDTLDQGIKYKKDVAISFYDSLDNAKSASSAKDTWAHGSSNFKEEYDDTANTMTISMTDSGLAAINPGKQGLYMVISYKAVVQSANTAVLGDSGNANTVKLTYGRTNTSYENTISDKTLVYTYGINLTKTFADSAGDATAVQFVLYNSTDKYYMTATGSDGTYYITDGTHGAAEANGTKFSPNADGKLVINGLEADTYTLREIKTDAGYSLLKEDITIAITSSKDKITPSVATVTGITNNNADIIVTNVNKASAKVDGNATNMSVDGSSTNGRVDMSVVNTQTFVLPQTGGVGTIVFTMIGACVVILGIFVITRKGKGAQE
jgi:LPXTG-motif cell wall-anchored protein